MWQISRPPYEWCEFGQVYYYWTVILKKTFLAFSRFSRKLAVVALGRVVYTKFNPYLVKIENLKLDENIKKIF